MFEGIVIIVKLYFLVAVLVAALLIYYARLGNIDWKKLTKTSLLWLPISIGGILEFYTISDQGWDKNG